MEEIWKDVPGYEGLYQVSDQGRVRSLDRFVRTINKIGGESLRPVKGEIKAPGRHSGGLYLTVCLSKAGRTETRTVHALVCETYIGPRPEGLEVLHVNGNGFDNALDNLRYGTPKENSQDRIKHGRDHFTERRPTLKLSDEDVEYIRRSSGLKTQRELALEMGVRQTHISRIILGQRRTRSVCA